MKKFLLTIAMIATGLVANAQDITFGAKAGANFANLGGDTEGTKTKTSFHIGAVAEVEISDKFSVQPELLYSAQGADIEGTSSTDLDYLLLPIMAKYYVAEGFSLEAGPQVGFLLSAKSGEDDVKDNVKSIDFGVNLGLGYKLDNGLNFAARYNLGLSNINDIDGSSSDVKNSVIQLSVGYNF